MTKTYRLLELFSGIGSQRMALERLSKAYPELRFEHTVQCDIDENAARAYSLIHGETPNLGDISKVEMLPECDILTYSFPCQDLSAAGRQKGMEEGSGTRSSLLWEVGRLLKAYPTHKRPEWLLMENVPMVCAKKNIDHFNLWIDRLSELGYSSEYKVLNSADFGIPQARKRCFMISHYHGSVPAFPEPFPLMLRLKDCLEENVPDKYYLKESQMKNLTWVNPKTSQPTETYVAAKTPSNNEIASRCYDIDHSSPALLAAEGTGSRTKVVVPNTCEKIGDLHRKGYFDNENRVYSTEASSPTLLSNSPNVTHCIAVPPRCEKVGDLHQVGYLDSLNRVYSTESCSPTILTAKGGSTCVPNMAVEKRCQQVADLHQPGVYRMGNAVYSTEACSPVVHTMAGGTVKLKFAVPTRCKEVADLNNNCFHQDNLVYDTDYCSPTLHTMAGGNTKIKFAVPDPDTAKPMCTDIVLENRVRVYDIDQSELAAFLKTQRDKVNLSTTEIAARVGVPMTEAGHWFRTDKYGSIPDPTVWPELKKVLEISTEKWDAPIMEFKTVPNSFDTTNRAYSPDGVSPTITASTAPQILKEDTRNKWKMDNLGKPSREGIIRLAANTNYKGECVYSVDGVAPTMRCLTGGGCTILDPLKLKSLAPRGYDTASDGDGVQLQFISPGQNVGKRVQKEQSVTLCANPPKAGVVVPTINLVANTQLGYNEARLGDGVVLDYIKTGHKRIQEQICPTMTTRPNGTVVDNGNGLTVRKITPCEAFRLMGFSELTDHGWVDRAYNILRDAKFSDSKLYHFAGNSIVVDTLYYIFKEMMLGTSERYEVPETPKKNTLDAWF